MRYTIIILTAFLCACNSVKTTNTDITVAHVAAEKIVIEGDSTPIYIGGYGSSMVYTSADSCFYLLTDRGPNVDGEISESKVFPIADYAPTIGKFRLVGDSLVLLEKITLKQADGTPFTGLPNIEGDGVTGETAYDLKGEIITNPSRGLDTEGLAIAPDGTFWVSDEYAPFVMQFDRNGLLMREMSPTAGLPAYYAKRRPNRGMEGLTISKDGRKLYCIMQSPLYVPDKSTKDLSVNNRILVINLDDNTTTEYIYQMESPKNVVSEISFINDSTMLVLERDGDFPKNGKGFKRVYRITTTSATDVSNKEIEMLSLVELQNEWIKPVCKALFVDILATVPNYRHDKPEGISMIGDSILCVVNDDDFGIGATINGSYAPKQDCNSHLDKNTVYFIPVSIK